MLAWHVPYLGWTRLPADVSEFEITRFFSLRAVERSAVLTRNSLRARQAAEAQILWEIRQALRRGSLYVPHSLSFRDKQVLCDTTGTTVRAPGSQRPLPEVLEQLFANLEVGLEHLDEAVWFEHIRIDGTKIHQHPLAPQEAPVELESIGEELYASLPTAHLPELMMAIDSEIRFSWILLGREPADEQELLYVYAALLGHAMDLTAQRVSLMTPGLSVGGLTSANEALSYRHRISGLKALHNDSKAPRHSQAGGTWPKRIRVIQCRTGRIRGPLQGWL